MDCSDFISSCMMANSLPMLSLWQLTAAAMGMWGAHLSPSKSVWVLAQWPMGQDP